MGLHGRLQGQRERGHRSGRRVRQRRLHGDEGGVLQDRAARPLRRGGERLRRDLYGRRAQAFAHGEARRQDAGRGHRLRRLLQRQREPGDGDRHRDGQGQLHGHGEGDLRDLLRGRPARRAGRLRAWHLRRHPRGERVRHPRRERGGGWDGANVQLYSSNRTYAQMFCFRQERDGAYSVMALCSGKYLDVSAGSRRNGANVQQWTWNGSDAQCGTSSGSATAKGS